MNINIIAAIGKNNELGKNNDLIWKIKEDLSFFKNITMGNIVVMGKNTYKSLPNILKGRKNIVISSSLKDDKVEIYDSITSFINKYKDYEGEIFIIGGASLYKQFLPYANNLYLTLIDKEDKDADIFFPQFNKEDYTSKIIYKDDASDIKYDRVQYIKK